MAEEVLLQVNNIDVFYGTLQVLWDVSLEVRSGEIVAVAGANEADRAYVIETGRIVLSGNASDLIENPEVKNAYFGT